MQFNNYGMNELDHSLLRSVTQSQRSDAIYNRDRAPISLEDQALTAEEALEALLQEAENLSIFDKLKHRKWQIRRKAYMDLNEFFTERRDFSEMREDNFTIESFVPWLKNIVNEQNLIALSDGLRALNTFISNYVFNKSLIAYFAGEIIERLGVFKTTIQALITEIIPKLVALDENNVIPNEILKRLEHCKNYKYQNSLLTTLNSFLMQNQCIDAALVRLCFKSMLQLLEHTNKIIRVSSLEVIKTLYSRVEEQFDDLTRTVFGGLRSVHLKDLGVLKSCPKLKGAKLIKLVDGTMRYTENNVKNVRKVANEQKVDLNTLLPDKYLEVPYLINQNEKQKKLEELNRNIEAIYSQGRSVDGSKDCSSILHIITVMLEDQNILINGEATKTMRHLMRIFSRSIPTNKLKHILLLIVEKLKGKKKTQYNSTLTYVLDDCLKYECMNLDTLVEFVLYQTENNRNHSVRIACINWLTGNFLDFAHSIQKKESLPLFDEALENISEKELAKRYRATTIIEDKLPRLLMFLHKIIQNIQKKDALIKVKEACQEFLDRIRYLDSTNSRKKVDDFHANLSELSSIKNSKIVNMSNVTLAQQLDCLSEDKNSQRYRMNTDNSGQKEGQMFQNLLGDKNISAFSPDYDQTNTKEGLFGYEKLSNSQKESFNKLVSLFNELKGSEEHVCEKLDQISAHIEKMDMDCIQTCQEPILKCIWNALLTISSENKRVNSIFEQMNTLLIKINRICLELTNKVLGKQLKILMLFLSTVLHYRHIEKVFESAYMTCSVEVFLSVGLEILAKMDTKYCNYFSDERLHNSVKFYVAWVCQKLEKSQNCLMDENRFKRLHISYSQFKFRNMPQLHGPITLCLEKKVKRLSEQAYESSNALTKSYETPNRSRKSKFSSPETGNYRSTTCENQETEKEYIGKRVASVDVAIRDNISHGLRQLGDLLDSIKKRRQETTTGILMSPQSNFVSPNRHWKRGMGRETPLRNALGLAIKGQASNDAKPSFELSPEEIHSIVEGIALNLSERELNEFESTMRQLRSVCTTKECLLVVRSIINTVFWRSSVMRANVMKERIFSNMLMFCESIDKLQILYTIKNAFMHMNKTFGDQRVQLNYFTYLLLDFISNWFLLNINSNWSRVLSPIAELITSGLASQESYSIANHLLTRALEETPEQELKKTFELELIQSTRLYQVFSEWYDSKFPTQFDEDNEKRSIVPSLSRVLSPIDLNTSTIHAHSEPKTDVNATFRDRSYESPCQPNESRYLPKGEPEPVAVCDLQRTPTSVDLRRSFERALSRSSRKKSPFSLNEARASYRKASPANNISDFQTKFNMLVLENENNKAVLSQNLQSSYNAYQEGSLQFSDTVTVPFEHGEMEFAQVKPSLEGEIISNGLNMRISSPDRKFSTRLAESNRHVINTVSNSLANQSYNQEKPKQPEEHQPQVHQTRPIPSKSRVQQQDSAEKWRDKYIQEKEKIQKTINLLDKTQSDYEQKCNHMNDILLKLEEQRKVNEQLLNKFNEVSQENKELKEKTEELQKIQAFDNMMVVSRTNGQRSQAIKHQPLLRNNLAITSDKSSKEMFTKKMQEILLTSNNLQDELNESLLDIFENLSSLEDKLLYVADLKGCLMNYTIIEHLTGLNHRYLLELSIKLCISENTQKEIVLSSDGVTFIENELTQEMQIILDILLRCHNMNTVLINLVKILSDNMPLDFDTEMTKTQKMSLKLTIKCIARLTSNFKSLVNQDIRVFDILIGLYKLFKLHPPEKLKEDQPSIKEYDLIYRNLKVLNDTVIDLNPQKAKELVECLKSEVNKNIFLDYIQSYLEKYYSA